MATLTSESLIPSPSDWQKMGAFSRVLQPLKIITETMSGENYPTLSFVYPTLINIVNNHLFSDTNDLPLVRKFKKTMKQSLENHFKEDTQREL